MEFHSLEFIAAACAGQLRRGAPQAQALRVCTDSRQVQAGDVFFALRGERFDAHAYVGQVAAQGAAAVVVEPGRVGAEGLGACALIEVDNTRAALGRLAGRHRQAYNIAVVAVGGSNGKTTTKELVAAVLRQKLRTLWSQASFNNDIGVPLTLLELNSSHQAAVLEVGTNHPGELAPLVKLVGPTYGIITSIGREHLEFFGDLAGVLREEGELAAGLGAAGKLFINGDSPWAGELSHRTSASVVRVGQGPANAWRLRSARLDTHGTTFRVESPQGAYDGEYRIGLLGRHQALNGLLALALGAELGLRREELAAGLAQCKGAKMRLEVWEVDGVRVLDDTYNANADSMEAALQTLGELPCKGRRLAVLGDMAELGATSEAAHEEVGKRAAQLGVEQLFAVGKMAAVVGRGARAAGLTRVFEFSEVEAVAEGVRKFVRSGDLLLLKASRLTRLERVAELLRGPGSGRAYMASLGPKGPAPAQAG